MASGSQNAFVAVASFTHLVAISIGAARMVFRTPLDHRSAVL